MHAQTHPTVVVTVLNEAATIEQLITHLRTQSRTPSEIIVVDGGSVDKTLTILQALSAEKSAVPLHVLSLPGSNRSRARNHGIAHARSPVIAVTDAGCVPKPDWLEKLMTPFDRDPDAEVVAGYYDCAPANFRQRLISAYTCTLPEHFDAKTFLPSSRSIAFHRESVAAVGGYPEELDTCEDLVFAEALKAHAQHWYVVPEAQVIWSQPESWSDLQEKIFHYALGDLHAGYTRHVKKIHSACWRVSILVGLAFPLVLISIPWVRVIGLGLVALYIFGTLGKQRRLLKYSVQWWQILIAQVIVDVSLMQALLYFYLSKTIK